MNCDICGKNSASVKKITKSFGKGKNIFIIENIPMIVCSHCGESYLTSETLHEIERIKIHKNKTAEKRSIPVLKYY
jgi:YgiT-type zinc finger domain-containing protein